jgi:hypothetical protein
MQAQVQSSTTPTSVAAAGCIILYDSAEMSINNSYSMNDNIPIVLQVLVDSLQIVFDENLLMQS